MAENAEHNSRSTPNENKSNDDSGAKVNYVAQHQFQALVEGRGVGCRVWNPDISIFKLAHKFQVSIQEWIMM